MITYHKLAQKLTTFKSLTGLTILEFEALLERFAPAWVAAEQQRLSRPNRKRAIGGGRKYELELRERLLMVLVWLRLYLNTEAMGFFFGVDKATVSRNCRRHLKVLRSLGDATLGWPEPPKRGEGKTIDQALEAYADLLAIVDCTEQKVRRSQGEDTQKKHYSGKKKTHTRKTAIVVNERGLIRAITSSTPGSQHDLKHVATAGVIDEIPKDVTTVGDAGFDGLQNYYPERSIGTPHKARRNHPLQEDQKLANRLLSSERIVVENTLCELKHFKALKHPFRHAMELYDDTFRAIAGLVNWRIAQRLNLTMIE